MSLGCILATYESLHVLEVFLFFDLLTTYEFVSERYIDRVGVCQLSSLFVQLSCGILLLLFLKLSREVCWRQGTIARVQGYVYVLQM